MSRYSNLAPLIGNELLNIASALCSFFSPMNLKSKGCKGSVSDFFNWYEEQTNINLHPRMHKVTQLIKHFETKRLLIHNGNTTGSAPFANCYICIHELSILGQKGHLWLGEYLGKQFLAEQIEKNLVLITGKTKDGDISQGSGILLSEKIVLTCKHVLDDMTLDHDVEILGTKYAIAGFESHLNIDFGFIELCDSVINFNEDVALRNASILEEIVIAGYPKVTGSKFSEPIFQSGEINGSIFSYLSNHELTLISSISRPGNSGGPLLSLDGKILGIVVQSLERRKESVDGNQNPLPFFACLPSQVIINEYKTLKLSQSYSLPVENYQ